MFKNYNSYFILFILTLLCNYYTFKNIIFIVIELIAVFNLKIKTISFFIRVPFYIDF